MMMVCRNDDVVEVSVEFEGVTYSSLTTDWRWASDETGEIVTHPAIAYYLNQLVGRDPVTTICQN